MWISISNEGPSGRPARSGDRGFALIEVLLGLVLALTLALGLAPVWVSFQGLAAEEADRTVWTAQGRVAVARFERDLRLAGVGECPFQSAASLLEAGDSQIVLLVPASGSEAPIMVEWELVGETLMRRWGPCPAIRPATFPHSLYSDSKTMLTRVDTARSAFTFEGLGLQGASPPAADLHLVDSVTLRMVEAGRADTAGSVLVASAAVGR